MKPEPLQLFFAHDWLLVAWVFGFGIAFALLGVDVFGWPRPLLSWLTVTWTSGICAFAVTGVLFGYISAMVVLGPLYEVRARVNGAPFRVGDEVQILIGEHRGTVAKVYEVWAERRQVRAELGELARKDVRDVFGETSVMRVASAGSVESVTVAPTARPRR